MMKKLCVTLLMSVSMLSQAGLVDLDNKELVGVTGQGGADLSLTLSINHQYANDMSLNTISRINGVDANGRAIVTEAYYQMRANQDCALLELCRIAISQIIIRKMGNENGLVFKQSKAPCKLINFRLEGTTILNKEGRPQTAMMLKFFDDKPLKIRNLGFASLSVGSGENGYFNTSTYNSYGTSKTVPTFDKGQEQGFMGLNVHGNLHLDGNLKIFSYNCSGTAGSRC